MLGHERLSSPKNDSVFLLDKDNFETPVDRQIRTDLEGIAGQLEGFLPYPFSWDEFVSGAVPEWQHLFPPPNECGTIRPTMEQLRALPWSNLVPKDFIGPEDIHPLLELVWKLNDEKKPLKPSVWVTGTMGSGKSGFTIAMQEHRPGRAKAYIERYEDNPELPPFYRYLADYSDPRCYRSQSGPGVLGLLRETQGLTQGWFGARKFLQTLIGAIDREHFWVFQDTPHPHDASYNETQYKLKLATDRNREAYLHDYLLRTKLIPYSFQLPTVGVCVLASFSTVVKRISQVREREIEKEVPSGYLAALHFNTLHLMMALRQMGIPVLAVDAETYDFRPGQTDRLPVVARTWEMIDQIAASG